MKPLGLQKRPLLPLKAFYVTGENHRHLRKSQCCAQWEMRSAKQGKPRALLRLLKKEMKIKSSAYARIPKPASTGVENADEFTLKGQM